jgi:GAF domain-containing protein
MTTPSVSRIAALSAAFIDLADTMVNDFDVVDLVHRLAAHCVRLLDVSAAGLLLTDGRGNLQLLASSDEHARIVELFQLQAEEQGGPCVECFHTGRPVAAVNLSAWSERWPGFVAEAQREGFETVHALPMRLRDQTIGGLNLFRTGVVPLSRDDLLLGQALADIATIAILQQRTLERSETLTEQLQKALNSRVIIEQAKGALSHRGRLSVDEAFEALREYARSHRELLTSAARQVVTDAEQAGRVLEFSRTAR